MGEIFGFDVKTQGGARRPSGYPPRLCGAQLQGAAKGFRQGLPEDSGASNGGLHLIQRAEEMLDI